MKHKNKLFVKLAVSACTIWTVISCTDLNVDIESELTPNNFPKNAEQFDAATGGVYSKLASRFSDNYWRMQEISTDAVILPARDGNWDDGGAYRELHKHTWTPDNGIIKDVWKWGYEGINLVNQTLLMLEPAPQSEVKDLKVAQIRYMRALYYFFMMDLYGNIPILKNFGDRGETNSRAEVFDYIVSELNEVKDKLPAERTLPNYARPTKWSAHALLAKLYMNAEVYTGVSRNNEAIAECDIIINSGLFDLDEDYMSIFAPNNGPNARGLQIKETIFAVWYDPYKSKGNIFSRYSLHPSLDLVGKYNLPSGFRPSNCMSTLFEFYQKYDESTVDKRMAMWLRGPQYKANGDPIIIKTKKGALDIRTPEAEKDDPIDWHFGFGDALSLKHNSLPEAMDVGKDLLGDAKGIRNIKFWPDPNMDPSSRNSSNNMPIFRYADILMMKAEAILRGGSATSGHTAVELVNKIRKRAGTSQLEQVTLVELREERAREFAWETWRRNDMIRFGEFNKKWELKYEESPVYRTLYPIPFEQIRMNDGLKQNPGYPTN